MLFLEDFLPAVARITSTIYTLFLGFIAAYYTSMVLGVPISIFFVFITVANELIDMLVQTSPAVEGGSKLPKWMRELNLEHHPVKSFISAMILISLGVWQAGMRFFMLSRNFLNHQKLASMSSVAVFYGALFIGGCAAIFNCANFIINFGKFWRHEIKGNTPKSKEASGAHEREENGFEKSLRGWLNQNTWLFDKLVGTSMLLGAVLYFITDYTNFSQLLALAAASSTGVGPLTGIIWVLRYSVMGFPIGAVIHGAYAYLNQMVLWGFNNKKFYVNHMDGDSTQEKSNKLPLIGFFHMGSESRRAVLYTREFILCMVDILNAVLIVPTFGLALGIVSLMATMFCRWIVYYFQSRQEEIDSTVKPISIQRFIGDLPSLLKGLYKATPSNVPNNNNAPLGYGK